jgi:hypothetical protein
MNILSILNVSNRENPGSDSGVIFHKILFEAISNSSLKISIASPFIFDLPSVNFIEFEPGLNKYDVRFRFDWDKYKNLLETTNPDIIFCHQVEQCSSIRALITAMGKEKQIRLITYYHYLPALEIVEGNEVIWDPSLNHSHLAEIIFLKVVSALMSCDLFFVTSQYSKRFLIRLLKRYNISYAIEKIIVMAPPTDPFMSSSTKNINTQMNKNILYSSRLYEQYGTDFLISIIEHYKNTDVKFTITDFFSRKSAVRKNLDTKTEQYRDIIKNLPNANIVTNGDVRRIYRDEIVSCASLVLGPYRKNANWSMGMLDAFGLGIPGIAPNFASFPEFTPSELLFSNKQEAIYLIDKLLCDLSFWNMASEKCKSQIYRFSPEVTGKIFMEALNKI